MLIEVRDAAAFVNGNRVLSMAELRETGTAGWTATSATRGAEPESPEPGSTVAVAARASSEDGFDAVVRLTEAGRQRACKDGPNNLASASAARLPRTSG